MNHDLTEGAKAEGEWTIRVLECSSTCHSVEISEQQALRETKWEFLALIKYYWIEYSNCAHALYSISIMGYYSIACCSRLNGSRDRMNAFLPLWWLNWICTCIFTPSLSLSHCIHMNMSIWIPPTSLSLQLNLLTLCLNICSFSLELPEIVVLFDNWIVQNLHLEVFFDCL